MTEAIYWKRDGKECSGKSLTLHLPDMPVVVQGGDEGLVYRRVYHVQLPDAGKLVELSGLWTFIGLNIGDNVEADIELSQEDGTRFYMRSFHRHNGLSSFESWDHHACAFQLSGLVRVAFVARCGRNEVTGVPKAEVHFGVVLLDE